MALDGRGTFMAGPVLMEARRVGIPLFFRHRLHCPGFWIHYRGGLDEETRDLVDLLSDNDIDVSIGGVE